MGELKRATRLSRIILVTITIILNLFLFAYQMIDGKTITDFQNKKKQYFYLLDRYSFVSMEENLNVITADKIYEGTVGDYYKGLSVEIQDDFEAEFNRMKNKIIYLSGYHASIINIMEQASILQKHSLFNNQNNFSYNNIIQTAKDFENVKNIEVPLNNDRAVDEFLQYNLLYYIAGALMLIYIYDLMAERNNGMWVIVHGAPYGRSWLAVVRIMNIIMQALIISAGLFVTTFLEAMFFWGGWRELESSIHTINTFAKFTYGHSRIEYIICLFLLFWTILSCLGILLWTTFVIFRNRNVTLVLVGIVVVVETLLYNKIGIQSSLNAIHYINILNLLNIHTLYSGYANWGIHTKVIAVFWTIMYCLWILTAMSGIFVIYKSSKLRPEKKVTFIQKFLGKASEIYQYLFSKSENLLKEVHKLLFTAKGYIFILSMCLISIYFCFSVPIKYTDSQKERDEVYIEHGGQDYGYIQDLISKAQKECDDENKIFAEKGKMYKEGIITLDEYSDEMNKVIYYQGNLNRLSEYQEKIQYLEDMKENYNLKGWLISDRTYDVVLGPLSQQREQIILVVLIVGVMLFFLESEILEYSSSMDKLIRSSEHGRGWMKCRKILVNGIITLCLFVIVYLINYVYLSEIVGFECMDAPLVSLSFVKEYANKGIFISEGLFEAVISISIKQIIFIRFVVRLILVLISLIISLVMSHFTSKKKKRAWGWIAIIIWIVMVHFILDRIGIL